MFAIEASTDEAVRIERLVSGPQGDAAPRENALARSGSDPAENRVLSSGRDKTRPPIRRYLCPRNALTRRGQNVLSTKSDFRSADKTPMACQSSNGELAPHSAEQRPEKWCKARLAGRIGHAGAAGGFGVG